MFIAFPTVVQSVYKTIRLRNICSFTMLNHKTVILVFVSHVRISVLCAFYWVCKVRNKQAIKWQFSLSAAARSAAHLI